MLRAPIFRAVGLLHLLSALRSLFTIASNDGVNMIVELLSVNACPAGVMLLLRMAAAASLAASGSAFALASAPGMQATSSVGSALALYSAGSLFASSTSVAVERTAALPRLMASKPLNVVQVAGLSALIGDVVAQRTHECDRVDGGATVPIASLAMCLDIDGTLVLTDDLYFRTFQELLAPHGYEVDEAFYRENVHGKVDADVFGKLLPDEEPSAISAAKDALFCKLYREHVAAHGPPTLAGLAQALSTMKALGIRCIAVTNAPRGAADVCVESLKASIPAASIIEDVVVGAECARAKPHPDPYHEAMARLGVSADQCVVVEDSATGIRAGAASGARAVVGMRSAMEDAELRALGASASLPDWHGVTEHFLRRLARADARTATATPLRSRRASRSRWQGVDAAAAAAGRVAAPLLAVGGASLLGAPTAIAERTLLCRETDTSTSSAAARTYGASLLALAAVVQGLVAGGGGGGGDDEGDGRSAPPAAATRSLAASLLAAVALQLRALQEDGHVLRGAVRRAMPLPLVAAGVAAVRGLVTAGL